LNLYGDAHREAYDRGRTDIQEALETGELPPGASRRIVGSSLSTSFLVGLLAFLILLIGKHWSVFPTLGVAVAIWLVGGIYAFAKVWVLRIIGRARMRRHNISNSGITRRR
jgi:hypothetical protein